MPFLTRDEGPDLIGGHPYWAIHDLVAGRPNQPDEIPRPIRESGVRTAPEALAGQPPCARRRAEWAILGLGWPARASTTSCPNGGVLPNRGLGVSKALGRPITNTTTPWSTPHDLLDEAHQPDDGRSESGTEIMDSHRELRHSHLRNYGAVKVSSFSSRSDFQAWLDDMDLRLMRYREILTVGIFESDYSRTSVQQLCAELLRSYPERVTPFTFTDDHDVDSLDGSIRYIGQTHIRHFGGRWVHDEAPESMLHGFPVLLLDVDDPWPISPRHLISATVLRRESVILQVFDSEQQRYAAKHGAEAAQKASTGSGTAMFTDPPVPTVWAAEAGERAESWAGRAMPAFDADFSAEVPDGQGRARAEEHP